MQIATQRRLSGVQERKMKFSHWDSWSPTEYLKNYFSKLGQESFEHLKFLVRELKKFEGTAKKRILDFGSGPTIFAGLAAVPYASEIHMCDFLECNLDEIRKWFSRKDGAFNWQFYTEEILKIECQEICPENAVKRVQDLRRKTTGIFLADASFTHPVLTSKPTRYPIVISSFCAESATHSRNVWQMYMKNIFNTVEDSGSLLVAALRNCRFYRSGKKIFPSANINEHNLKDVLEEGGFDMNNLVIEVKEVPQCAKDGFTQIILAHAIKKRKERIKFSNLATIHIKT